MWPQCEFRMHVWNVLQAARWKYRTQKLRKKSPSVHYRTNLSGYIFATEARIDNRKNWLNSNISSWCPHNMVNVGNEAASSLPTSSGVWGSAVYRCKVRLLGYPPRLWLIASKLVLFDSKQCCQAPLIKNINPARVHTWARTDLQSADIRGGGRSCLCRKNLCPYFTIYHILFIFTSAEEDMFSSLFACLTGPGSSCALHLLTWGVNRVIQQCVYITKVHKVDELRKRTTQAWFDFEGIIDNAVDQWRDYLVS